MAMVRVVVAESGKPAEVREIDETLEAFQALVGGHVEAISGMGFDVYVNEEGHRLKLAPNRIVSGYALVGTLIVTKHDRDGDTHSLTESEAAMIAQDLDRPERDWTPETLRAQRAAFDEPVVRHTTQRGS